MEDPLHPVAHWSAWPSCSGEQVKVPTQHLTIQTDLSVARRVRRLLAASARHGVETACAKLRVQQRLRHQLGFATLTKWFELTKLRYRWTIDGLLCCVGNKVQSRKM